MYVLPLPKKCYYQQGGKNPGLKKKPAQWFFFGFFGFFYVFAQKREFLGFFQFQNYF
jgi:hypothetical protein